MAVPPRLIVSQSDVVSLPNMMNTYNERFASFRSGSNTIFVAAAFTLVNSILAILGNGTMFMFSLFFPYVTAVNSDTGIYGLSGVSCFVIYSLIPTALFALLGFLVRKENRNAMTAAAVAAVADTVYMLIFLLRNNIFIYFIISIIFHAWMVFSLITALISINRMPSDLSQEPGENHGVYVEEAGSHQAYYDPNAVRNATTAGDVYRFDREYAKQNGALKTGKLIAVLLGYVIGVPVLISLILVLESSLEMDSSVFGTLLFITLLLPTIAFIYLMVKLSPYLEQRTCTYTVDNGLLSVDKFDLPGFNHRDYYNIQVLEDRPDHWKISYIAPNGKERTAVIPKSYPGLESYFAKII